jgi:hypothetical protein
VGTVDERSVGVQREAPFDGRLDPCGERLAFGIAVVGEHAGAGTFSTAPKGVVRLSFTATGGRAPRRS